MRRHSLWVVVLFAAVACTVVIRRFAPLQLTPSELNVGNLPRVPMQESAATVQCTRGLAVNLKNANGEWSVIQKHFNGVEKQPFLAGGIPEDFGRGRRPAQRYFRQIWQKKRSLEVSPLASFRRALTLTVPCKIRLQQFGYLH